MNGGGSLNCRDVLFLDGLPEFGHSVLEVLRPPVEYKVVTVGRAHGWSLSPRTSCWLGNSNKQLRYSRAVDLHNTGDGYAQDAKTTT